MRNEVLHGYLIHHRKYRERSQIVHIFSQEYGRIDGVLRQNSPPQYQPLRLQASGKSELKNFSHLEIQSQPIFFQGDAFFCGFYLNELILRLCPLEEALPQSFLQYASAVQNLQHLNLQTEAEKPLFLKQILRQFEHVLLQELGYAIDFSKDANQNDVLPNAHYQFQLTEGFLPVVSRGSASLQGELILSMQTHIQGGDFSVQQLQCLTKLYRQMITALLGDRPLKSRQLWIQHRQVQN